MDYDCVDRNIISKADKEYCLERVGTKLGATDKCVNRIYDIGVRLVYLGNKQQYTVNGLYLWINRSGSLREMSESDIRNFPRFSRYLVLHDEKEDKTILLYGIKIKNVTKDDRIVYDQLVLEADLSVPFSDMSEAMRFINYDIIHGMYLDEYDELLNGDIEQTSKSRDSSSSRK